VEIAVVFHSILIGVSLGLLTTGVEKVRTLTVAVAIHQFFEGSVP
jgi:zinc transporter 1/2/3